MEVLGAILGVSTIVIRTSSTIYSLVDTWREAPEGLHRLLDDLRRSQQFFEETEAGLREMYLGLSEEALKSASFASVTEALVGLFEDATVVIGRIEKVIENIIDGNGLESGERKPEDLGKRRKLAWLRQSTTVAGLRKSLKSATVAIYRLLVVQNIRVSLGIGAAVERSTAELKSHISHALASEIMPEVVSKVEELRTNMLSEVRDPILRQMARLEDCLASLRQSNDRAMENEGIEARNTYPQASCNRHRQRRRRCDFHCPCRCHVIANYSLQYNTWKLSLFGLVVRVSGGSIGGECTSQACVNTNLPRAKEVMLHYNCPNWLYRGGISAFFSSNMHGTPELNIRMFNRLETGTPGTATNIFGCIERGNVEGVRQLLQDKRASVYDVRGSTDETPLLAALYRVNIPMIRLLLQAGADPFAEADRDPKVLYEAIQIHLSGRPGSHELIELIPAFESIQLSPLHLIVSGVLHANLEEALGKPEYLSYLNHVDPESTWSPLDMAAFKGDTEAVSKLLRAGASVSLKKEHGTPPLFQACWFSHYEVAKLLVEAGADVNAVIDDRGTTPIICAVNAIGHAVDGRIVSLLRQHGADVNCETWRGATPLCFAASRTSPNAVTLLVEHGANVNHVDKDGDTPLIYAVFYSRHENVRILLERGSDYRYKNRDGKSILHYLAAVADVEMLKIFTDAKMRGLADDLDGGQKMKTPIEIFNQRESTAELRQAFNELLESISKDDEEESEGSDEFCDAVEEL